MAEAVGSKFKSDLNSFKLFHGDENEMVAPGQNETFSSGLIINGFTPTNRAETETLCKAIKHFNVRVVLVLDNEKLEKDIQTFLKQNPNTDAAPVNIIKVPKSPGIQSRKA